LENPLDYGAITILWTISGAPIPTRKHVKMLKLAYLCQIVILGSVEEEIMVSALSLLKSNSKNNLDKHLGMCLRLCVTKYGVNGFSFERALVP
jgi:hypothetical protein